MNIDIVTRWNQVVLPGDTVINLGDVSFRPERYTYRLNGNHILIRGNHDKTSKDYLYADTHHHLSMRIGKWNVLLIHRPIHKDSQHGKNPHSQEILDLSDEHDFVVCGHVHEKWLSSGKNLNIGVDMWGFSPISIGRVEVALNALSKLPIGVDLNYSVAERNYERVKRLSELLDRDKGKLETHPAWKQLVRMGIAGVPYLISIEAGWKKKLLTEIIVENPDAFREVEREKHRQELRKQGFRHSKISKKIGG